MLIFSSSSAGGSFEMPYFSGSKETGMALYLKPLHGLHRFMGISFQCYMRAYHIVACLLEFRGEASEFYQGRHN